MLKDVAVVEQQCAVYTSFTTDQALLFIQCHTRKVQIHIQLIMMIYQN